jgi:hypothetical protein
MGGNPLMGRIITGWRADQYQHRRADGHIAATTSALAAVRVSSWCLRISTPGRAMRLRLPVAG